MFRKILLALVVGTGLFGGANAAQAGDVDPEIVKMFDEERALRGEKKYDEAFAVLDKILLKEPKNASITNFVYSERAWIYNAQEKYDLAIAECEKALSLNSRNSEAWCEYGYALMKLKRYDDAAKMLSTALEKHPRNWDAYAYLIELHEAQGQFLEAADVRSRKAQEVKLALKEEAAKKDAAKKDATKKDAGGM